MKLIKVVPTLVVSTFVLAACSNSADETAQQMEAAKQAQKAQIMENAQQQATNIAQKIDGKAAVSVQPVDTHAKAIAYTCRGENLSATYAFNATTGEPEAVNLSVGKKKQVINLKYDKANADFTSFKSDKYVWNVDSGLTAKNVTTMSGGMLTQKGKDVDRIISKLCSVNKTATKALNR
ncbi:MULTISPECIES: hypothetical protein [Pasteurellaceae]|uniref:Putative lipoprotein n=1 Tax=Pasteurella bettyae CCUG 2042 TaxID=1095749 RepID=I3DHH5_9PAST|nr:MULTISPECIES: hypothetical protein [Pasteurellaceae]EIJ71168.1 putative lipoprotein [Pasteurella bettyae CCUG 2042]SUB20981.1 Uncharacterised protein [Pasteurella bettyae]